MARLGGGRAADEVEWQVFAARQASALVYGVASTGIHCRAGCPARVPLRANLRVFETVERAEACGYRACKRCGGGAR